MPIFLSAPHKKIKDAYEDVACQVLAHHSIPRDTRSRMRALTQLVNLQERDPARLEGGYDLERHEDPAYGHQIEARPARLSQQRQTRSRAAQRAQEQEQQLPSPQHPRGGRAAAAEEEEDVTKGLAQLSIRGRGGEAATPEPQTQLLLRARADAQPPASPSAHKQQQQRLPLAPASPARLPQPSHSPARNGSSYSPVAPPPHYHHPDRLVDDASDRQSLFTQNSRPNSRASGSGHPGNRSPAPGSPTGRGSRNRSRRNRARNSTAAAGGGGDAQLAHINAIFSQLSLRRSKLEVLQAILRVLEFDPREIPDSVTQCRKKLHTVHVNIADVAEALQREYGLGGGGGSAAGSRPGSALGGRADSDAGSNTSRASYASSIGSDWQSGLSVGGYKIPRYTLQELRIELRKQKKRRFPLARVKDELLQDLLRPIR